MKKKLLGLIGLIMGAASVMAAPVTLQQAQQQAQQFMAKRQSCVSGQHRAPRQLNLTAVEQPADTRYYVFNANPGQGFVIVSGDDRTASILGYADSGSFDVQNLPENMREWLEGYNDQLRWLSEHPTVQLAPAHTTVMESVNPLLVTTWNQNDPYNRLCPVFLNGNRSVTGCVATAFAQVLYYHAKLSGKPAGTTKDIDAYECDRNWGTKVQVAAHPKTTFDWDNMLPSYIFKTDDTYKTQCTAIATLMAWVGASVKMDYADVYNGGSSSNLLKVVNALPEYYDFEGTYADRDNYTYDTWQHLVFSELLARRPVLYSGNSSGGGHAFVIDGYDGDGLFHVNWGWGGGSNGYFQLSILNPNDKSGIGASSSDDGYSFGQNAIFGLQPSTGQTPVEEGAQMTPRNITISGNTVTFAAWNWSGAEHTFDMGIGYVEEDGTIDHVVTAFTNRTFAPTYGNSNFSITIDGNSRPAGSYKMVVTSKTSDSDKWLTTMNPEKNYIEALFDGNGNVTLTLHPLPISLQATDFSFPGSKAINEKQPVEVTIKNNGDEFYDRLYLFASQDILNKGNCTSYSGITIPAGTSGTASFTFTPESTGIWYVWVATDYQGENIIGQSTVMIANSGTSEYTDNIDLTMSLSVTNAEGSVLIGNLAQTHISVANPNAQAYQGRIYLMRWLWTKADGNRYTATGGLTSKEVTIPAGGNVEFDLESLTMGGADYYSLSLYQQKNGSRNNTELASSDWYTLSDGYAVYAADGTKTMKKAEQTISIPADAVFVDLRGQSVVKSVSDGGNPNTLFAIDEGTELSGATNIIIGTEAESIALTDGYDFYVPFAFTAKSISYTRTFNNGYRAGAYGWQSIMLPFNVNSVQTEDGSPIDWFRSSADTGKQFWVMEYNGDTSEQVFFTQASELKAYKPYLIAVPGADYPQFDLTGKAITFSGSNAQLYLSSDVKAQVGGSFYKFIGLQSAANGLNDIYTLDAEGHQFTKGASAVDAFHAYFSGRSGATALGIGFVDQLTGINSLPATQQQVSGVYNLNGVKVGDTLDRLPAGIYIVNGKKIIK